MLSNVDAVLRPEEIVSSPDIHKHDRMRQLLDKLRGKRQGHLMPTSLTDDELMEVHTFLKETAEQLWAFGPEFMLATDGVERLFQVAESYRRARCH